MRYILLIYSDESRYPKMSEQELGKLMAAYGQFSEELVAAKAMGGGERLRPTSSATSVQVRNGKTLLTDGPFAETKEQFGGYYIIDVPNLDAALAWAAKVPSAQYGTVEVRPIWE
jgi:hypothetical protein